MPVTGSPAAYQRGYSFTRHSRDTPTVPQPGDRLDQEFDDIAFVLTQRAKDLDAVLGADGQLKAGAVSARTFEAGLFDGVWQQGLARVQPLIDAADAAMRRTLDYARQVSDAAAHVQRVEETALGAAHLADVARTQATTLLHQVTERVSAFDQDEALAANSASTAQAYMVQAEAARDMSMTWAEYLAGPVQPAPPGWPEAIDDGMWSSKWWAVRASEIVGTWGNWYLGASAGPPAPPSTGTWPPGTLYYDITTGLMMVWDGTSWHTFTNPMPAASKVYVYVATANQAVFMGADLHGATPVLTSSTQPVDVHVNGVRLVEDRGDGTGDYVVDAASNAITVKAPLAVGSIVQWDLLLDPALLAPGAVNAFKLIDINLDPTTGQPGYIDGTRTNFALRYIAPGNGQTVPATPGAGVQLQIVLDGVLQEAGVDYTTSASTIAFAQAPPHATRFAGVWYQPGPPVSTSRSVQILS